MNSWRVCYIAFASVALLPCAARAEENAPMAPPSSAAAFNPAISLILSGAYTNLSADPKTAGIDGFIPSGAEPPARGFNLGESELGLSANIDPDFRGTLNYSLAADNTAAVEEGYVETLGLGHGLTVKFGRFLSGIGYLNEKHAHTWDFADAPLIYQAFLAGQLHAEGVQVKWLAPLDSYLEWGMEAGRGGAFPSTDNNKNGSTLGALFVHSGGDVGVSNSWRAGLSLLRTAPQQRRFTDNSTSTPMDGGFSGESRLLIVDGVWKWAPQGNANDTNLIVQGEMFRRQENGDLTCSLPAGSALSCATPADSATAFRSDQSGGYLQAVWQWRPYWRIGLRLERLNYGSVDLGALSGQFATLAAYSPHKNSVMIDWSGSEFSRLRLQFARDRTRAQRVDNQVWLQYQMSMGSHGAHLF